MPSGFYNGQIMYADNLSFDGTETGGQITANGQILIGSSVAPNIRVGTLTSADGSITFTTGNGTINLSSISTGGLVAIKSPLINVKNLGITTLFTPTRPFVVTGFTFYADLIVGTTFGFIANIGTNGALYDNIINQSATSPTITGNHAPTVLGVSGLSEIPVIPAGTPLVFDVTLNDTNSTTNNEYIYTIGYYFY